MAKRKQARPHEELVDLLQRQMRALDASSSNYDAGAVWEAERLATTVYNLVHDGGSITSLLTQLGVKGTLRFTSSGAIAAGHVLGPPVVAFPALLIFEAGPGSRGFVPKLGDGPRLGSGAPNYPRVPFEDWWEKQLIYQEKATGKLNRMRLVSALRNQDGGSHIGALTDPIYIHLKKNAGWKIHDTDGSVDPVSGLITASMRQVAWEVSDTLRQLFDASP